MGDFIGDVNQGGPVNFKNVFLNPHGNGTHTECVGHISSEPFTINQCLKEFHLPAVVVTVTPIKQGEDSVVTAKLLEDALPVHLQCKALVIRTVPNDNEKMTRNYSGTNPPFLDPDAMRWINDAGFDHLLIDTPSVDKEQDGGTLSAHHIFWNYPQKPLLHKSISELVYVDNAIPDGQYFLFFQICSLESDASPSKILLFAYEKGQIN